MAEVIVSGCVARAKLVMDLRKGSLKCVHIPKEQSLLYRELVRARQTIVKDITRWKNRIKHFLNFKNRYYVKEL